MAGFSSAWRRIGGTLIAVLLAVVMLPQAAAMATPRLAPTTMNSGDFPEGYFFIRNTASGLVLDVKDGGSSPGASIILWPRKASDYDNQLWKYEDGFLVNKESGLCLEVKGYEEGGNITPGTPVVQAKRRDKPESINQLWAYNYQQLMPYDPKVALSGQNGDVSTPGTQVVVDRATFHEAAQEWMLDMP